MSPARVENRVLWRAAVSGYCSVSETTAMLEDKTRLDDDNDVAMDPRTTRQRLHGTVTAQAAVYNSESTSIHLRFDGNVNSHSIAIRLRYDHSTTFVTTD